MTQIVNGTYQICVYVYDVGKKFFYPANVTDPRHQEAFKRFSEYAPKIWHSKTMTEEEKEAQFQAEYKEIFIRNSGKGISRRMAISIQIAGTIFLGVIGLNQVRSML